MAERSYTIIGTGALGGYYGARLHHAGLDVRFLLHSDFDHVRDHGLIVESPHGDFSIAKPSIFAKAENLPPSDITAVCLKTTQNHLLTELLPHSTRDGGAVVMMQNGLGIERQAAAVLPSTTILGGLAFLCSNKVGPGHIRHLDYGAVRFGQHNGDDSAAGVTEMMKSVAADFERGGIQTVLEPHLLLARWKKLVWNIPYNGLCVIHDCTTDRLMGDTHIRALCRRVMEEVRATAASEKVDIDAEFIEKMLRDTDAMASYKPSMKLDFDRGLPLEIEAIYSTPLRVAEKNRVKCPEIRRIRERLIALTS